MKLRELIESVDAMKPNAFSNETKTLWVNEVEGMIQTNIALIAPVDIISYDFARDSEKKLIVEAPHEKLYRSYLAAMIDYANGEADMYQNSMAMFNAHYEEFKRWYIIHYRPADVLVKGDYY